ncbi:DUF6293 family protein [Halobacteriales archaeon Cl-PHB]
MGIRVPDRVHISPLGYEEDRVVQPPMTYNADRVFLLEHDEPESEKPDYHSDLKAELREKGIDVQSVTCDIFDLYSVLGKVAEIITSHPDDELYVNLSTGSKISAIGGMIACMVTRDSVSVTPYYVRAEGYTPEDEQDEQELPVSYGMESISELPTYPIQGPSRDEIAILQYIAANEPVRKKQLIRQARQTVDRFERNARKKDIQVTQDPHMGEYRLLDNHILEPLSERECIEITEVGRSKEVSITEEGKNTLRAFDYLL